MDISLKERIEKLVEVYGTDVLKILHPFTDIDLVLEPVPDDETEFDLWASSQNVHVLGSARRGWDSDVGEYVGWATHVVYLDGEKVGYERVDDGQE